MEKDIRQNKGIDAHLAYARAGKSRNSIGEIPEVEKVVEPDTKKPPKAKDNKKDAKVKEDGKKD